MNSEGYGDLVGRTSDVGAWQVTESELLFDQARPYIYDGLRPERGAGDDMVLAFEDPDGFGSEALTPTLQKRQASGGRGAR